MRAISLHLLVLATATGLVGCADGITDREVRRAWLVEAITDDNRVWMSRDSGPLAVKYGRMYDDLYDYMRATGAVNFRDWGRPGTGRQATAFVESNEAATVLIAGDPHPENVGTYLPGAEVEPTDFSEPIVVVLEVNDFDGAGFGPWTLDLRRGALGLAAILVQSNCSVDCRDAALRAYAQAYVDEIEARAFVSGFVAVAEPGNAFEDLINESIEEGLARKRVEEWSRPVVDGRRFEFDQGPDELGRGLIPLSPDENAQLDRILSRWTAAPEGFRELDRARSLGQGVASIPAIRYAVLYDRGTASQAESGIVMFREVVDPPPIPGRIDDPSMRWNSNANRIADAAFSLWSRPDADPWMAGIPDGDMTFKAVTGSSFAEGLAHEKVIGDSYEVVDPEGYLSATAAVLGSQLAATHQRSRTWEGGSAPDAIAGDLAARSNPFVNEVVSTAEADLEQLLLDHRLYRSAIDELGPLLGADRLGAR